ncbi:MAG: YeeE/YedE thiosulfate transporter family protein [Salibacteraceae bacterium]
MEAVKIRESQENENAVRQTDSICVNQSRLNHPWYYNLKYLLIGAFLGFVFVKSEVVSWFRIQEMFRFQSFHMYGIIMSAIATGMVSIQVIKWLKIKTIHGERIALPDKQFNMGQIYGGILFGLGWAITGACPGPLYAQIGAGYPIILVTLLSAIAGTWTYAHFREKLPH